MAAPQFYQAGPPAMMPPSMMPINNSQVLQEGRQYKAVPGMVIPTRPKTEVMNWVAICQNWSIPWILFTVIFAVLTFSPHAYHPGLTWLFCLVITVGTVLIGAGLVYRCRLQQHAKTWSASFFIMSVTACLLGMLLGAINFGTYMNRYYDILTLNLYTNVEPSETPGEAMMDAGRVFFTENARLDTSRSLGYKDYDVYCVAPISQTWDSLLKKEGGAGPNALTTFDQPANRPALNQLEAKAHGPAVPAKAAPPAPDKATLAQEAEMAEAGRVPEMFPKPGIYEQVTASQDAHPPVVLRGVASKEGKPSLLQQSSSSSSSHSSSSSSGTPAAASSSSGTAAKVPCDGKLEKFASYDLWAVGTNCCSGLGGSFSCGQFSNSEAHAGLRLVDDSKRPYYRKAVEQAQAEWNFQANFPVFFEWVQDPTLELNKIRDAGLRFFVIGVFGFFLANTLVVAIMGYCALQVNNIRKMKTYR